MLSQDLQAEVLEIAITVGPIDDGPVHFFHEAIRDALTEVIQNLGPPVAQRTDKLGQVAVASLTGFPLHHLPQ